MPKFSLLLMMAILAKTAVAQDSLLLMLNDSLETTTTIKKVSATFKATQIVNTPTVEAPARQTLQFLIMHRFGKLSDGAYALFGLDNADIRFGLDYGITNNLSIGFGRSSFDKTYDASFKYKLLKQSAVVPFSLSLYGLAIYTTFPRHDEKPYLKPALRTAYTTQLLLARKFTSAVSLQITPALVHYNMVPTPADKNNIVSIGAGGRVKLTKRISLNAEYSFLPAHQVVSSNAYSPLSLGLDVETGGHVFQFVFTNSRGTIGPYYLTQTRGSWGNKDIYFGFNISRIFSFSK